MWLNECGGVVVWSGRCWEGDRLSGLRCLLFSVQCSAAKVGVGLISACPIGVRVWLAQILVKPFLAFLRWTVVPLDGVWGLFALLQKIL
jgi:hypothetical protein